jgi:sulfite reductase beta subunit-like hemoprotein
MSLFSTAMTESRPASPDLLRRVRAEYEEMPGLHLTDRQATRLWGSDPESCRAVLAELERVGFLARTRNGGYVRT